MIIGSLGYFCFASSRFLNDYLKLKVTTKIRVETVDEVQVSRNISYRFTNVLTFVLTGVLSIFTYLQIYIYRH